MFSTPVKNQSTFAGFGSVRQPTPARAPTPLAPTPPTTGRKRTASEALENLDTQAVQELYRDIALCVHRAEFLPVDVSRVVDLFILREAAMLERVVGQRLQGLALKVVRRHLVYEACAGDQETLGKMTAPKDWCGIAFNEIGGDCANKCQPVNISKGLDRTPHFKIISALHSAKLIDARNFLYQYKVDALESENAKRAAKEKEFVAEQALMKHEQKKLVKEKVELEKKTDGLQKKTDGLQKMADGLLDEIGATQMRMVKYGTELSAEKKLREQESLKHQETAEIAREALRIAKAASMASTVATGATTPADEQMGNPEQVPLQSADERDDRVDRVDRLRALVAQKVAPFVTAEELEEMCDEEEEEQMPGFDSLRLGN